MPMDCCDEDKESPQLNGNCNEVGLPKVTVAATYDPNQPLPSICDMVKQALRELGGKR